MKNNKLRIMFLALMLAIMTGCAATTTVKPESEEQTVITAVTKEDNRVTIVSNKQFAYTVYSGLDPYKITVEIPDMRLGAFTEKIVTEKAGFSEINPQQIGTSIPAVKFDITLQTPSPVTPVYGGNTLALIIKSEEPVAAEQKDSETRVSAQDVPVPAADVKPAETVAAVQKTEEPAAPVEKTVEAKAETKQETIQKASAIIGVEIKKSADAVKVVISANGSIVPNIFPVDDKIVIDVPDVVFRASIPSAVEFPMKGVRVGKHKSKVRLVLDLKEKSVYDVSSLGNLVEVSFRRTEAPASVRTSQAAIKQASAVRPEKIESPKEERNKEIGARDLEKKAEGKYKGAPISLDFQDAEIGSIFRLLADVNGYNLVLDPAVKGKITIKLMNVPWDQAMDIILNSFNLGKSIDGNILWIAPSSVFAKILDEKSKTKETEERVEDLKEEILRINYASASDVSAAISSGKLLGTRGSVTVDSRMNTVIVKDTSKSIEKIKSLVKIMDMPKQQVMIEAKIVEVSTDYSQSLGIKWGGSFYGATWPTTTSGGFAVNTPTASVSSASSVTGGALSMTLGNANSLQVDLSLQALETMGKSRKISNPKILTMDNEAATITQGTSIPVQSMSEQGVPTVKYVDAALALNVKPTITPDGYIQLDIDASNNSLGTFTSIGYSIEKKALKTKALVKNGETLVVGGIYTTSLSESESGIPGLSKIPILGWFFTEKSTTGPNNAELLVFITPTIVQQQPVNGN